MESIQLLNVRIDNVTCEELLESMKRGVLVTPNVDHIVLTQSNYDFYKSAGEAEYSICDSRILQIVLKLIGRPLKGVIPGSSFFPMFCDYHAKDDNVKIFLLGAREGVGEIARKKINDRIGREIVVGTYSPPFGFEKDEKECERIIDEIKATDATVVLVGLGNPKQTLWIQRYKNRLPQIDIFMALGATIDFEAGTVKRAPRIVQRLALEWLYRFFREPRRLFKRYFVRDMKFFGYLFLQMCGRYRDPFAAKA